MHLHIFNAQTYLHFKILTLSLFLKYSSNFANSSFDILMEKKVYTRKKWCSSSLFNRTGSQFKYLHSSTRKIEKPKNQTKLPKFVIASNEEINNLMGFFLAEKNYWQLRLNFQRNCVLTQKIRGFLMTSLKFKLHWTIDPPPLRFYFHDVEEQLKTSIQA